MMTGFRMERWETLTTTILFCFAGDCFYGLYAKFLASGSAIITLRFSALELLMWCGILIFLSIIRFYRIWAVAWNPNKNFEEITGCSEPVYMKIFWTLNVVAVAWLLRVVRRAI